MRKRFETLKPSFPELSVTAELKHAVKSRYDIKPETFSFSLLLLVSLHVPALSVLAPVE